jgi:hypothetical protein
MLRRHPHGCAQAPRPAVAQRDVAAVRAGDRKAKAGAARPGGHPFVFRVFVYRQLRDLS